MSDALASAVTAQTIASLKRENAQLHRTASEVHRENQLLKRQLFHTSAVLDVAMNALNAYGVSLEPPLDLRALRADVKSMSGQWSGEVGVPHDDSALRQNSSSAQSQRKFRLQCEIKEHSRSVNCAAFGPDDLQPLIASGGLDKKVVVSNFMTGAKVLVSELHEQNVNDICWLSNNICASASFDRTVKCIDIATSNATPRVSLYTLSTKGFALSLCSVTDMPMSFAATDSKKMMYLCDMRTNRPALSWECSSRANTVAYDPTTKTLLSGHGNGILAMWDVRRLRSHINIHEFPSASDATPSSLSSEGATADGSGIPKSPFKGDAPSSTTDAASSTTLGQGGSAPQPIVEWYNEVSHCNVLHASLYGGRDDTKRLVVVSEDNMIRLYNRPAVIDQEATRPEFQMDAVITGIQTRSFSVRAAFWRGQRDKRGSSMFDDVDVDAVCRHLLECDVLVCGGADNFASVLDVTDPGVQPVPIQKLDGHRGRVCGAAVHHSVSKPIVATFSEDTTVRIWMPSK